MEPSPDDGLRFPGEPGFTGFKQTLAESTVRYELRLLDTNETGDTGADPAAARAARLREIQRAAQRLERSVLKDFIWQRESFRLEVKREGATSFLAGHTEFGDSIEDEWLVVWLVRELSRQFPDVWARVSDSDDGEFLLIEAANVLPKWLNPDVAENRVWINRGELLIIPQAEASASASGKAADSPAKKPSIPEQKFISLPNALMAIRGPHKDLLHSPLIEEEAFFRLREYPQQIRRNMHNTLVNIPRKLAFVLHHMPASITAATEAFYLRDPIALRPLQEKNAALLFPPADMVVSRVRFTRIGFAQVRSQHFPPPLAWEQAMARENAGTEKETQRAEMGMKLTCGFEMLASDPQNVDKQVVRELRLLLDDLATETEELPSDATVTGWGTEEDDESWMNIDFNDLEDELRGRRGGGAGFGDATVQENLQKLVSRFEDFLNDDALADDDEDDDDEEEDSSENENEVRQGEDKATSFDEDEFTALMREMMGMPPETMRELMGHDAGAATGLGDAEHPEFSDEAHLVRKQQLFEAMDEADKTKSSTTNNAKDTKASTNKDRKTKNATFRTSRARDASSEEDEIKQLSALMEAELRRAGALDLSEPKSTDKSKKKLVMRPSVNNTADDEDEDEGEDEDEPLDEDFNLVSNMLRGFASQGGASGPSGNLLGMLGMRLPRDEGQAGGDGAVTEVDDSNADELARPSEERIPDGSTIKDEDDKGKVKAA